MYLGKNIVGLFCPTMHHLILCYLDNSITKKMYLRVRSELFRIIGVQIHDIINLRIHHIILINNNESRK